MPYNPGTKYSSPVGGSLSSYLPPGNLNPFLIGRSEFSTGLSSYGNRSPLYALGGYGYSSPLGVGQYGGPSYTSSGPSGYPGSSYSSPSSLGKKFSSGLLPISEHSSPSSRVRVSRPPKFNHVSSTPAFAYTNRPRTSAAGASNRIAVWNTEDIDVTTPRRPSHDESANKDLPKMSEASEVEEEVANGDVGFATPGDISSENRQFGTLRRGRTVIRIQTQHLKENPYLKMEDPKKKPKKTAGEKMKEKWAIQSKKKKHSGYRPPSLTDIRAQQEALRKEIEERQAALLKRNTASTEENGSSSSFSREEEAAFFSNINKLPRRKSTKKYQLLRPNSQENIPEGAAGSDVPQSPTSPVAYPVQIPLSRSSSNASQKNLFLDSLDSETNGDIADNEDDEIDFWASEDLRSKRSTMIIRSYFRRPSHGFEREQSAEVESIHEEDEEDCDLEVANIMDDSAILGGNKKGGLNRDSTIKNNVMRKNDTLKAKGNRKEENELCKSLSSSSNELLPDSESKKVMGKTKLGDKTIKPGVGGKKKETLSQVGDKNLQSKDLNLNKDSIFPTKKNKALFGVKTRPMSESPQMLSESGQNSPLPILNRLDQDKAASASPTSVFSKTVLKKTAQKTAEATSVVTTTLPEVQKAKTVVETVESTASEPADKVLGSEVKTEAAKIAPWRKNNAVATKPTAGQSAQVPEPVKQIPPWRKQKQESQPPVSTSTASNAPLVATENKDEKNDNKTETTASEVKGSEPAVAAPLKQVTALQAGDKSRSSSPAPKQVTLVQQCDKRSPSPTQKLVTKVQNSELKARSPSPASPKACKVSKDLQQTAVKTEKPLTALENKVLPSTKQSDDKAEETPKAETAQPPKLEEDRTVSEEKKKPDAKSLAKMFESKSVNPADSKPLALKPQKSTEVETTMAKTDPKSLAKLSDSGKDLNHSPKADAPPTAPSAKPEVKPLWKKSPPSTIECDAMPDSPSKLKSTPGTPKSGSSTPNSQDSGPKTIFTALKSREQTPTSDAKLPSPPGSKPKSSNLPAKSAPSSPKTTTPTNKSKQVFNFEPKAKSSSPCPSPIQANVKLLQKAESANKLSDPPVKQKLLGKSPLAELPKPLAKSKTADAPAANQSLPESASASSCASPTSDTTSLKIDTGNSASNQPDPLPALIPAVTPSPPISPSQSSEISDVSSSLSSSASAEKKPKGKKSKPSEVMKSKSGKQNVFGLQNRVKSKEEKRKSREKAAAEADVKIVEVKTSAVIVTEEEPSNKEALPCSDIVSPPTSDKKLENESKSVKKSDSTEVLPNPTVEQLRKSSKRSLSERSSSGSIDSPCITPKSSERESSTSTSSSSTLSAGTSGSSRRMPSPPSDESDEDQETIARRICPQKSRPKYRRYEIEDFQFLKVLGKGSFGKVLLAELKGTDCYFAIKCLKKDVVLEDDDVECTMIERKVLLMGSKHPYLCHLLCTFQTESHLFFVMEYLNGGDLMFHIQQTGRFSEDRARFYAAEIVSGLKFLHKKGIIYRDLKLDNILLDFEGHIRIADFGMCKLQIYLDRTADTFCGTPDYMAPEIIKGLKYNQCVDWWAFGILLYEMLIGQSPFSGCDEDELFWSICNEAVRYPRFLSRESKRILEMLLEKDASKRVGTVGNPHGEVKDQPFFDPINWDKLERREVEPPYKPKLKHSLDVQYFDTTFTREAARLTPVDKEILRSMDQTQFDGFSYTNPHTTD